jgi:hypothetical protein
VVGTALTDNKIRILIVGPIFVVMMNRVFKVKRMADRPLSNDAMLHNITSAAYFLNIALTMHYRVRFARAIRARIGAK